MKEKWKYISGYEHMYEISNIGRIRSYWDKKSKKWGKKHKVLHPETCMGYQQIKLATNGKFPHKKIHRLVAEAFIKNKDNHPCINHIDSNPSNNCSENLEWCTYKQNNDHAVKKGRLKVIGENNPRAILSESSVLEIRDKYKKRILNQVELANLYGVCQVQISSIILKKAWKHI